MPKGSLQAVFLGASCWLSSGLAEVHGRHAAVAGGVVSGSGAAGPGVPCTDAGGEAGGRWVRGSGCRLSRGGCRDRMEGGLAVHTHLCTLPEGRGQGASLTVCLRLSPAGGIPAHLAFAD